jgi:hypothetical protein
MGGKKKRTNSMTQTCTGIYMQRLEHEKILFLKTNANLSTC